MPFLDYTSIQNPRPPRNFLHPFSVAILHVIVSAFINGCLSGLCLSLQGSRGLMTLPWVPGCSLLNLLSNRSDARYIFIAAVIIMLAASLLVGIAFGLIRKEELLGRDLRPIGGPLRAAFWFLAFYPFPVPSYLSLVHFMSY